MSAALLPVRVARKAPEAEDICRLELVSAGGAPLPPFSAGAHVDVHLPGGLVRQYSLCNNPAEAGRYVLGVLREPASRGGSVAVHERLSEGDELLISPPRNLFPLAEAASGHLLLAGGIGLTPLLAMAETLAARGEPFALHVAARHAGRVAFRERLQKGPLAAHTQLHLDDGPPAQRLDLPVVLAAPAAGQHLYVCGPAGFIAAVLDTARAQGWPEAQLHCEHFGAAPAAPGAPGSAGDRPFELRLARSQRVVPVSAVQTAAQALNAAGIFVPTSCEQGICGTCLTRVLEGECEHRDQYLEPGEQAANDQFLPCCSRARGAALVLDL
jgi:vanillate O-demethylase ferredoxin subunit